MMITKSSSKISAQLLSARVSNSEFDDCTLKSLITIRHLFSQNQTRLRLLSSEPLVKTRHLSNQREDLNQSPILVHLKGNQISTCGQSRPSQTLTLVCTIKVHVSAARYQVPDVSSKMSSEYKRQPKNAWHLYEKDVTTVTRKSWMTITNSSFRISARRPSVRFSQSEFDICTSKNWSQSHTSKTRTKPEYNLWIADSFSKLETRTFNFCISVRVRQLFS